MSHKDRSIANTRQESKRIYYQRILIKKLQQENTQLKSVLKEIIEYIEKHKMVDYDEFEYISTSPRVILEIIDKGIGD